VGVGLDIGIDNHVAAELEYTSGTLDNNVVPVEPELAILNQKEIGEALQINPEQFRLFDDAIKPALLGSR
jgi:hypothetical protein